LLFFKSTFQDVTMSQPNTPSSRKLLTGLTATAAATLLPAGKDNLAHAATGLGAVGGRCVNQSLPAPFSQYVVEGGAEFIGPTQDRMYSLVQQLGLKTFSA